MVVHTVSRRRGEIHTKSGQEEAREYSYICFYERWLVGSAWMGPIHGTGESDIPFPVGQEGGQKRRDLYLRG